MTIWMDLLLQIITTFIISLEAQTLNYWVLLDSLEIKTAVQFDLSS